MEPLVVTGRLMLAAVFAVAGIAKLSDQRGARAALADFGTPVWLVRWAAPSIPLAELAIAIGLIIDAAAPWAAKAALLLLMAFSAAIARVLVRHETIECRCFGPLQSSRVGPRSLLRNVVLAAMAAAAALGPAVDISTAAALATLAAAGGGYLLLRFLRQHEDTTGLPVGARAPRFSLPELERGVVSLESLLAGGKPVLLAFIDSACAPCKSLLPDLARWQREWAAEVTLAVVAVGHREELRAQAAEHGLRHVLVQRNFEVHDRYRAGGTPAVVFVSVDRRIASRTASGPQAARALVAHWLDDHKRAGAEGDRGSRHDLTRTPIPAAATGAPGLDQLAQSVARPISRRRLIEITGLVVAGAAVARTPGSAAASALATTQCVRCSCNGKYYLDTGACLDECKVGLDCYVGICEPVPVEHCCPPDQVACGTVCCPAGHTCVGNTCVQCASDQVPCGTRCCTAAEACVGGQCIDRCPEGIDAGGNPIDCLRYDEATGSCVDTCMDGYYCDFRGLVGGGCQPRCPAGIDEEGDRIDCLVWDPSAGGCRDVCPPGQYCDYRGVQGGGCVDACRLECAPYDESTNTCRDRCPPGKLCRASVRGGVCECDRDEVECQHACCPPGWTCHRERGCINPDYAPRPRISKIVTAKKGRVAVSVSCPSGAEQCHGLITITVQPPRRARWDPRPHRRAVEVGHQPFRFARGGRHRVRLRLTRRGIRLLRRRGRLRGRAKIESLNSLGGLEETSDTFRLRQGVNT